MRLVGWEERLFEVLDRAQRSDFEWGVNDCALFACDAIAAMTGVDPGEDFRGDYGDELGAEFILREFGSLGDAAHAILSGLGCPEIDVPFARRGDPVLAVIQGRETLGVCGGEGCLFLKLRGGLHFFPITSPLIVRAWRVP